MLLPCSICWEASFESVPPLGSNLPKLCVSRAHNRLLVYIVWQRPPCIFIRIYLNTWNEENWLAWFKNKTTNDILSTSHPLFVPIDSSWWRLLQEVGAIWSLKSLSMKLTLHFEYPCRLPKPWKKKQLASFRLFFNKNTEPMSHLGYRPFRSVPFCPFFVLKQYLLPFPYRYTSGWLNKFTAQKTFEALESTFAFLIWELLSAFLPHCSGVSERLVAYASAIVKLRLKL